MAEPAFSLCVYCGSREGADPRFAAAARSVGDWIGRSGGRLVYGGGRAGLMGIVADATQAAGGQVVGVIPQTLVDREAANQRCDELHVVSTMHERKAMLAERSNAFLALPGGIGTFEELFEAWTWRHLGYHDKPMGLLNVAGYYDSLISFVHETVAKGFMNAQTAAFLKVGTDPEPLLAALIDATRGSVGDTAPLRSVI
ncbi:TIGR00730 family Rossman fold protein [Xylophilus sp. GOD-11R]|uniref:LOG family protein n=1 Tax=Xylophilus sp. GOD-11R TaxID=3089814 RepID=UPI00298CA25D|nr:TIGR00730 family Rossman fold protein [Xylophilus sp. GOD-11R]WPB58771.1 TIGR00730 family Rossman fold protein [Xylophilus sp. GOD-11R]